MTFGEKLKSLRESNNMTQKQLAKELDVSIRQISYYESGNTIPKDPTLIKIIADVFDVTLDYLLDENNEVESKPYKFVKKLIQATDNDILDWKLVDKWDFKNNNIIVGSANYTFNLFSSYPFNDDSGLNTDDSYFSKYNGGGYLLASIRDADDEQADMVLFIYYKECFTPYVFGNDMDLIKDLHRSIKDQVHGVEKFINDFMKEDLNLPF